MNLSRKISKIIVISTLLVLMPALLIYYQVAKQSLLNNELQQIQYQIQIFSEEFESEIDIIGPKLNKLEELLNTTLNTTNHIDRERFDKRMAISEDGAWRNNRDSFDGLNQAGLFLPPDIEINNQTKQFYGNLLHIFDIFGGGATNIKSVSNIWYLGHDRSEVILDLLFPDFVYLIEADNDYTSTDWMTLASPDRNPQREWKWTPPLYDDVSKTWMVSVVYPLDINGEWVGTLGQDVELSSLFNLINSFNNKYLGEQHILQDEQGHFLLAGVWQQQLEQQVEAFSIDPKESELLALLSEPISNSAKIYGEVEIQGQSYQAIGISIQPMNWHYINLVPTKEITKPLKKTLYLDTFVFIITILAMSLLIKKLVTKMVSLPIEKIVERTRAYARGEQVDKVEDWGSEELNELSLALDVMHDDLGKETDRLAFMAKHDELTLLPNRNFLDEKLRKEIATAQYNKTKIAVLFIDLDQFKNINDSLGHSYGDKLLKVVSKRILSCLRETDSVARFGGDEFVILLTDINDESDIALISQSLLSIIKQPYNIDGYDLSVTASIGISLYPKDSEDVESLIQHADTAMYLSKDLGRNAFQFYTDDIHKKVLRRVLLEESLQLAIKEQQFVLYYQPKVNLETKSICGMEVLIRWLHPELGMIPPNEFISLAEETGLIVDIGEWVLIEACKTMNIITQQYPFIDNIAINLSVRQLRQENFIQRVRTIFSETQVDISKIEFEITESIIMEDVEATIRILAELKSLGVKISIDDFGTGYSSLSYLKRLPADTLKVDRAFVRELEHDLADQAITRSIIALAENLQLTVVAEGIETAEQDTMLTQMGCDYAQGYYFSKPVPIAEMTALLEKQVNPMRS